VLDVGGGPDARHDQVYAPGVRRIRLDLSAMPPPDLLGDGAALPVRSNGVDHVVLFEVLEHVPDPAAVLAEVRRVLRPDGTLVGSVPFLIGVHGQPDDFRRFTAQGLEQLLVAFNDVAVQPHGSHVSAAWGLLSAHSRAARLLNPALRHVGRRTNPSAPTGYTFRARC
jgi:SAM-dependent methyltransferase